MNRVRSRVAISTVVVVVVLAVLGIVLYMSFMPQATAIKDITASRTASSTSIRFEVVTSLAAQELGLGNRAIIPDSYAMLFVFQKPDRYGFWMKDMLAPIDIVWLTDKGTIMLIDSSVQPSTYPHVFYPPTPVKYVLETRAGFAAERGWTVGTKVPLPAPYGTGN